MTALRLRGGGCRPSKLEEHPDAGADQATRGQPMQAEEQAEAQLEEQPMEPMQAHCSGETANSATAEASLAYIDYEALLRSVDSGAVAPLRGSWLLELFEAGGRLKRRQDLPEEAFWRPEELRAIVEAARAHFADDAVAGLAALGHLFNALSYRWLAKGQPDPDGCIAQPHAPWGIKTCLEQDDRQGGMRDYFPAS